MDIGAYSLGKGKKGMGKGKGNFVLTDPAPMASTSSLLCFSINGRSPIGIPPHIQNEGQTNRTNQQVTEHIDENIPLAGMALGMSKVRWFAQRTLQVTRKHMTIVGIIVTVEARTSGKWSGALSQNLPTPDCYARQPMRSAFAGYMLYI